MTTTTKTADRIINRAPKGGAVSLVNGLFYRGGQFMPMVAVEFKPGLPMLMGSVRQVAWANRLRNQALANLNDEINARLLFLNDSPKEAAAVRPSLRRLMVARHGLMMGSDNHRNRKSG